MLERLLKKANIWRDREGVLNIDLGAPEWNGPSTLVFPADTSIRIDGKDRETKKGEEFLVKKWLNNGEGMTWGYLAMPNEPYFKALSDPKEANELVIIK